MTLPPQAADLTLVRQVTWVDTLTSSVAIEFLMMRLPRAIALATTLLVPLCGGCGGSTGGPAIVTTTSSDADASADSSSGGSGPALFVKQVLASKLVSPGEQCVFTADPTQVYETSGKLDIALAQIYNATFLVGNLTSAYVNVQGAVVRVSDSSGNVLDSYTRLAGLGLTPGANDMATYGPINLTIVDPVSIAKVAPELVEGEEIRLVTQVQFFGQTVATGQNVTSNTFEFPVDVCATEFDLQGRYFPCLVSFQSTDIRGGCGLINCVGSGATPPVAPMVPCFIGEDLPVDCSQCLDISAACNPNAAICQFASSDTDGGP